MTASSWPAGLTIAALVLIVVGMWFYNRRGPAAKAVGSRDERPLVTAELLLVVVMLLVMATILLLVLGMPLGNGTEREVAMRHQNAVLSLGAC
ncbi:hypothetical protein [Luteitalea sp.]